MATMKRGGMVAAILMLIAIIATACNQPYSQPPSVTNTPINPDSFFGSATPGTMTDLEQLATQTSLALTGTTTPVLITETPTGGVPPTATVTSTPNPISTATSTMAVSTTSGTTLPAGTPPPTYILQKGEWPYCIARRFDVNPEELLSLNRLPRGDIFYPNLTLQIPQSGNHFPPPRAFRPHPTTYTVTGSDQTLNGVACLFGDVYPSAIAQANGISESSALTAGQVLNIP